MLSKQSADWLAVGVRLDHLAFLLNGYELNLVRTFAKTGAAWAEKALAEVLKAREQLELCRMARPEGLGLAAALLRLEKHFAMVEDLFGEPDRNKTFAQERRLAENRKQAIAKSAVTRRKKREERLSLEPGERQRTGVSDRTKRRDRKNLYDRGRKPTES